MLIAVGFGVRYIYVHTNSCWYCCWFVSQARYSCCYSFCLLFFILNLIRSFHNSIYNERQKNCTLKKIYTLINHCSFHFKIVSMPLFKIEKKITKNFYILSSFLLPLTLSSKNWAWYLLEPLSLVYIFFWRSLYICSLKCNLYTYIYIRYIHR